MTISEQQAQTERSYFQSKYNAFTRNRCWWCSIGVPCGCGALRATFCAVLKALGVLVFFDDFSSTLWINGVVDYYVDDVCVQCKFLDYDWHFQWKRNFSGTSIKTAVGLIWKDTEIHCRMSKVSQITCTRWGKVSVKKRLRKLFEAVETEVAKDTVLYSLQWMI